MSGLVPPPPRKRYTPEEYFALEETAEERHEYIDGEILAMAGGTGTHAIIIANVLAELRNALRGKPFRPVASDLRVRYGRKAKYGYTDGLVVCGPLAYDPIDAKQMTLLNPSLIVEVLSESSERFDRGEKFSYYREIESFREYVLISQHEARIETFLRQDDGTWRFASYVGLDARVPLPSIGVELVARAVYADVTFPPPEPDA